MANKKKTYVKKEIPTSLDECSSFYGMDLDQEQKEFRDAIWSPDVDIVFCNSPAGTGKTTVALGTANILVQYGLYDRIIYMMSPVQEAKIGYRPGDTQEKLAPYFPGDTQEKLAPYFLPLYDAAVSLGINPETDINPCTDEWKSTGSGYIDCMAQTFLRGRNIESDTILIVDEAANMYQDELKTILTRIHDGAKVIVIGHSGQCDLVKHPERSGFEPYLEHFRDKERCKVCELHNNHRGWISRWADEL